MFKFEEICELIRLVGSTEVASVEIEHAGARVRIDGNHPPQVVEVTPAPTPAPAVAPSVEAGAAPAATAGPAATAAAAPEAAPDEAGEEEGIHYIVSPIVGTFYRAPNPEADPYVKVGDAIDVAKTLCIVEAMKLMNEIESDVSGTVVKVFSENAQPVEYGERLFAIRVS
jgi:acetyl-CoA carboxylase biotin carboxyl carrier protein